MFLFKMLFLIGPFIFEAFLGPRSLGSGMRGARMRMGAALVLTFSITLNVLLLYRGLQVVTRIRAVEAQLVKAQTAQIDCKYVVNITQPNYASTLPGQRDAVATALTAIKKHESDNQ